MIYDFESKRAKTLEWVDSLRISRNEYRYRFSASSGDSLFSSCFALFILDLFRETENLSREVRKGWAEYIKKFQEPDDGLFYPKPVYHPDAERAVFQLSCFCLSALDILGAKPEYRLHIVDRWKDRESVKTYCEDRGCHKGRRGSGNKAMFQAIMLTHEYEQSGQNWLKTAIDEWFDFHDEHQNCNGFWGYKRSAYLYHGLQNGFHQAVIYEYWQRQLRHLSTTVETALNLQDTNGHFAATLGGGSCKDYDAIHFLGLGYRSGILNKEIEQSFELAVQGIRRNWNADGGFCESTLWKRRRINHALWLLRNLLGASRWDIKYERANAIAKDILRRGSRKNRRWVAESQPSTESTLWDTWFRWLALAEISCLTNDDMLPAFKFQKHIGLGYSDIPTHNTEPVAERIGGAIRCSPSEGVTDKPG